MTRAIKLTILVMMIILPYIYGEYSYRQHLGTIPMQCVRVWEEEHCSKGRNCHYDQHALMLYDNGQTSQFSGSYSVGSWYVDESKWSIFGANLENEPSLIGKAAQIYRFFSNLILTIVIAIITLILIISSFIWLAFKTRYRNPLSFLILFFGTDADASDHEECKFMNAHPFWFYKEGDEK